MKVKGQTITINGEKQAVLDGLMWSELPRLCTKYQQFTLEVINARPKTTKQLGALYGLAYQILVEELTEQGQDSSLLYNLPESTGVKITTDDLHRYFDKVFPVYDKAGKQKTTRDFTTTEESQRYEKIQNFAAGVWQIVIPCPDPKWFMKKGKSDGEF